MDATSWFARTSGCTGKRAFSTPQLAKKVQRRRLRKKSDDTRQRQDVYHCRFCGNFHIGTKSKSRQPAPAEPKRISVRDIEGDDMS